MGKQKIDCFKLIEDRKYRNITFCKRKNGIIKKVIELARLCGVDVYMMIYHRDINKIVQFKSSENLDSEKVNELVKSLEANYVVRKENYTHKDYVKFKNENQIEHPETEEDEAEADGKGDKDVGEVQVR